MFKRFLLVIHLFAVFSAQGQPRRIQHILDQPVREYYQVNTKGLERALTVPMAFNNDRLPDLEIDLRTHLVTRVQLVYTRYVQNQAFDQKELNRQRLENFSRAYPDLFNNILVNWELVAQTGCNTPEECRGFFHGFIIHFRPPPDSLTTETEISKITSKLREVDSLIEQKSRKEFTYKVFMEADEYEKQMEFKKHLIKHLTCPDSQVYIDMKIFFNGPQVSNIQYNEAPDSCKEVLDETIHTYFAKNKKWWAHLSLNGEKAPSYLNIQISRQDKKPLWHKNIKMTILPDEKKRHHSKAVFRELYHEAAEKVKKEIDSTVLNILERNPDWTGMLIVQDVTASMFPYTVQTLVWHKLNEKPDKTSYFVFFNDGDRLPPHRKKTGQTGGVYGTSAQSYEDVEALVISTMRKGGGGDIEENNMEALIKAIEMCPECKNVIMIADNLATPRDMSLLAQVNRPVKIILCGTFDGINPAYLDFARINGGSVHTIEEDIDGLAQTKEGQTVRISGVDYILKDGHYQRLYR